ncbi:LysR family transcriptional regulator [Rhodococcus rhodnii]|uniref:LysR family transcriptional regulator n=1 Tax=Rhodococcus rhodnii TaxID=38312 RepID=A0A6P2CIF5_9NOCA|nr:LysR family transcriptional regulator [Rhodococcus rhodnii]
MKTPKLLDGRLKLRHLTLLDALAKHGSVVAAAASLHVTQPVATRSLQELEEIVGVSLFDRGPRGVTATIFGEALTAHARSVLAQLSHASRHIVELAEAERGTVVVGVHLAGSNLLLPRAILALKQTRPNVTVKVREGSPQSLLIELQAGRIDMIVGRSTAPPGDDLLHERLYDEAIDIVARLGHPLSVQHGVPTAKLTDYPWVLPGPETSLRKELEEFFARHGLPLPANRIEATSFLTVRQLLMETDALAAMPGLIARADTEITSLDTPLDAIGHSIGVTRSSTDTTSPSVAVMLDALRDTAATIDADRSRRSERPLRLTMP